MYYYEYYVKNNPPIYFQVHIFPFDWVLGAVTFQLTMGFHPIISYHKPHELTLSNGGYIILFPNKLFFNFHLNLVWQSKVIGPTSWVSSLGINGGEGKMT